MERSPGSVGPDAQREDVSIVAGANGAKYFATADLLEIAKDRSWLIRMTTTINTHWQKQNAKKCRSENGLQNGHSSLLGLSTAVVG